MSDPAVDRPLDAAAVLDQPVVDVGGVAMQLSASDLPRAAAVAALFRHAVRVAVPPDCVLRFTNDRLDVPDRASVTVGAGLELWRPHYGELIVRSARGLTMRASARQIDVSGDAPSLAREFRNVSMFALTHVLSSRGHHLLHGGAVVCDDRALLVLGGSGSGKSTLVLSALRSGWSALTDDLVAVHRHDGLVLAAGLPRPISIPRDVLVDEFSTGPSVPDDARSRVELPGLTLTASSHQIGGVILVARGDDSEAGLEPAAGLVVVRAVLGASTSLADPGLLKDVFAVAAAIARLPAWSLRHGTDPASRVDQARRRLEEIRLALPNASLTRRSSGER